MKGPLQCNQSKKVDSRNKCLNSCKCLLKKTMRKDRNKKIQKKERKVGTAAKYQIQNRQI